MQFYFISVQIPDTWEPQPKDSNGREVRMHMFDVSKDSPEYKEKLKGFFDTIGNTVTVVSLKRIQNPDKYQEHAVLLKSITKKYPELKSIDVKYLFHGCREETIEDIAIQGFNRNYAGYNGMIYCIIICIIVRMTIKMCYFFYVQLLYVGKGCTLLVTRATLLTPSIQYPTKMDTRLFSFVGSSLESMLWERRE